MLDPFVLALLPFDHFTRDQVAELFGVSYHTVPSFAKKGRVSKFDGHKYFLIPSDKGKYKKIDVIEFYRKIACKGALRLEITS